MPEYLAPGVYIEEIEIGAKPIEGVSTSNAGFLGYAERGPLDKPTLVTNFAEFERHFGGFLPAVKDSTDLSKIRWLAYAVKGFFENGGKRAYITRVAFENPEKDASKNDLVAKAATGSLPKVAAAGNQNSLAEAAFVNETGLKLQNEVSFNAEDTLLLKDGAQSEFLTFEEEGKEITLDEPLDAAYKAGTAVKGGTAPLTTTIAESGATAGDNTIALVDASGDYEYLWIDDYTDSELVEVVSIDANIVTSVEPMKSGHDSGITVYKLELDSSKSATLIRNANASDPGFYIETSIDIQGEDFILVGDDNEYHTVESVTQDNKVCVVSPPLKYNHDETKELIKLEPAVIVDAASEGTWGNSIKISVKPSSISSTLLSKEAVNSTHLDLETITGIETGTLLRITISSDIQYVTVLETHKTSTDTFVIVDTAINLNQGDTVDTEEFDLYITDGKNEEIFKYLSFDARHSRFIKKIVTEKSSNLIRIGDISTDVIVMPTPDDMPGWRLTGGNDGFPASASDIDTIYEGEDSMEPDDRTGLYTFKNVDEINIAAIPGITSKVLQSKLIIHCDTIMKDRFAVLDSEYGADLDRIRYQRNLYDTSFAALYYPWVYASDPLTGGYINVPPSGCVAGIYARTDVTRGVHKAPANEKINGVFQLEKLNGKFRIVNKGSQDILNPLGINCIRQFPGRGIRVWGARTITSNSLWKYVNVRRLFLFMEESIEKGTQWVVFEPNDEKLWARVKQTITQFLTRVWKDGALMGNTPEEAFFVKCDRTTMTQDDIDNGRLIVLIGVAPVKPAEFVIFRIAQWQGGAEVSEEE